jgi:adenosylcobinamide kinase / adenosylcobinamide-phosphate guanylyltransferase
MGALWFVTGGARSGKSAYAERLAARLGSPVTYIATLEPLDDEMRARIARHRQQRPATWRTVEAPRSPTEAAREAGNDETLLLDCLSLWVSNRLIDLGTDAPSPDAVSALEAVLVEETGGLLGTIEARAIDKQEVGARVPVEIVRNGQTMILTAELQAWDLR